MITEISLVNFKSWRNSGPIELSKITAIFGNNSSGKSSILQAIALLRQSIDNNDNSQVLRLGDETSLVDLGTFRDITHRRSPQNEVELTLNFSTSYESVISHKFKNVNSVGLKLRIKEMGSKRIPNITYLALYTNTVTYEITRSKGIYKIQGGDIPELNKFSIIFKDFYHPVLISKNDDESGKHFDDMYALMFDFPRSIETMLNKIYYIGPLRDKPGRLYTWGGQTRRFVGRSGEHTIDVILSNTIDSEKKFELDINHWLNVFGLVKKFKVNRLLKNRREYEIKLKVSESSEDVTMADVGFGISQVMPIIVQCFAAPAGSTLIIEQPELHLHPSVQANIADLFIYCAKTRNLQIIFESHSEHILRRLQRRIAEEGIDKEFGNIYFTSQNQMSESFIEELELDDYGNISNWPKNFFGNDMEDFAAISTATIERKRRDRERNGIGR